jgi:hypothetical protein
MLLGIDPGVTTGFCTVVLGFKYVVWQADTGPGHLSNVWDLLEELQPDEIVYEDFKQRPGLMKAELHSVQVIGVVELWAERFIASKSPIVGKYLPADCKAFWTNDKIKRLGVYTAGVPHGTDAQRVCMKHQGKDPEWFDEAIRKLSPPAR